MAHCPDGTRPLRVVHDVRNFYVDDVSDISKHRHDPWADPCERIAPTLRFVWRVAHAGDGDHGGSCAERAYEAPGIDRPTKP